MKYISTKDPKYKVTLTQAIAEGLAPNKGLFVPENYPSHDFKNYLSVNSLPEIAYKFLLPFFSGDPLEADLEEICQNTFQFPIELKSVKEGPAILELFHGPTGAFKDVGARFLAECFAHMDGDYTILVATSGDTGSAVSAAFWQQPHTRVIVLYPKGRISKFQENQLVYWGDNIQPTRVDGDFDTCQHLVKEAFSMDTISKKYHLSSANSINIGRLLPQCVYYVFASITYYNESQRPCNILVPTGNMGNAFAAIMVKLMGFPIGEIHVVTNRNQVIPNYFMTGTFKSRPSITTLANAMDVGNPSNLHRYIHLSNRYPQIRSTVKSVSITDEQIEDAIAYADKHWHRLMCPHTATAVHHYISQSIEDGVIVATAHPYKFHDIVEKIVGREVDIPSNLSTYIDPEPNVIDMLPNIADLEKVIDALYRNTT